MISSFRSLRQGPIIWWVAAAHIQKTCTTYRGASVKTISVKEAAEALGLSPRAIQYKLQNGDLKGTRTKNQYGVAEWRVWPNKDIAEAIARKNGEAGGTLSFSPAEAEAVDVEDVTFDESEGGPAEPNNWRQVEMERLEIMAEKLVKPLAERIEAQAVALREQERVIEDQNRQLRLLPDLKKEAERERTQAELRALEVEALNKQIAALRSEKDQLEKLVQEASSASSDLQAKVEELQKPWWKRWFLPPDGSN